MLSYPEFAALFHGPFRPASNSVAQGMRVAPSLPSVGRRPCAPVRHSWAGSIVTRCVEASIHTSDTPACPLLLLEGQLALLARYKEADVRKNSTLTNAELLTYLELNADALSLEWQVRAPSLRPSSWAGSPLFHPARPTCPPTQRRPLPNAQVADDEGVTTVERLRDTPDAVIDPEEFCLAFRIGEPWDPNPFLQPEAPVSEPTTATEPDGPVPVRTRASHDARPPRRVAAATCVGPRCLLRGCPRMDPLPGQCHAAPMWRLAASPLRRRLPLPCPLPSPLTPSLRPPGDPPQAAREPGGRADREALLPRRPRRRRQDHLG